MTPKRGVTLRAILIGVAFTPRNAYLVVQLETVWGVLLGIPFLVSFCYQTGMSLSFAFAFFGIYYLILFGFTRMLAELGPLMHGIHYFGPFQLIVATIGSHRIPPQTLTVAAPHWTHTKEFLNKPMPAYLESYKLAERANIAEGRIAIDTRKLWKVYLLATFLSIVVTLWAFLELGYKGNFVLGVYGQSSV